MGPFWSIITFLCISVLSESNSLAKPLEKKNKEETTNASNIGPLDALKFLRHFGYLEKKNTTGLLAELYSEATVTKALKEMQKFGAIPQTGKLDEATRQLLVKPRCGVEDVSRSKSRIKRFAIASKAWNKQHLTYGVQNWSPKISPQATETDLQKAFNVWADYARLQFSPKFYGTPDISISFAHGQHGDGDAFAFDGTGGTLAHAFYPYTYDAIGGDIHFDADENWVSEYDQTHNKDDGNYISFLSVAVHEIGHSLGLGHSSDTESVMFPYYKSLDSNLRLGYDDIMGLYKLYIQRDSIDSDSTSEKSLSTTLTTNRPMKTTRRPSSKPKVTTTTSTTKRPIFTTAKNTEETKPDLCSDSEPFDTMSLIRNELFVFKGKYMWRLQDKKAPFGLYPVKFSAFFVGLKNLDHIDAAYQRESDGKIVFFSDTGFFVFDGTTLESKGHISRFGLPHFVNQVDAAFVWGKNKFTYLFSGPLYWKYNDTSQTMEDGYPKNIKDRWGGVPSDLQAAMKWKDGKSYFFKRNHFWEFEDKTVRLKTGRPSKVESYWFDC